MRYVALMGLVFFLAGCGASLSSKECSTVDWYAKGESDVEKGVPVSHFYKYKEACAGAGIAASEQEYVKGYMAGQKSYCLYDNGYGLGNKGGELKKVCPSKSKYYEGYLAGIKEYHERREERSANSLTRAAGGLSGAPSGGQ